MKSRAVRVVRSLVAGVSVAYLMMVCVWVSLSGCSPKDSAPEAEPIPASVVFRKAVDAFRADGHAVDGLYHPVSPAWVRSHVGRLNVLETLGASGFRDDLTDCDDFSRAAALLATREARRAGWDFAPAFGQVATVVIELDPFNIALGKHALNFFIDPEGNLWFFEPQTGKSWRPSSDETAMAFWWII